MFVLLFLLLYLLANSIKHKLLAKFSPKNPSSSSVPNGPINLGAEYMVDIFAFTSRSQLDQCELVNRRFRAIIERHKNRLPTLKLKEQKKRRAEAFQQWKMNLKWAEHSLGFDIFLAVQWTSSLFFSFYSQFTNLDIHFLSLLIYFCYVFYQILCDDNCLYFFVIVPEILFFFSISSFLFYTGQNYLYSILFQIFLTLLIPLIIFQIFDFYRHRGRNGPPSSCRNKLD